MKTLLSLIFAIILFFDCLFSQCRLEVTISGIRNDKGNIMLQLFDENEKVFKQEIIQITGKKCMVDFKDIRPGKYAIRYYHDENMNGKMETNLVGKPTEGYGFSNNVLGKFGPPTFEKWLFDVKEDKKINLEITY